MAEQQHEKDFSQAPPVEQHRYEEGPPTYNAQSTASAPALPPRAPSEVRPGAGESRQSWTTMQTFPPPPQRMTRVSSTDSDPSSPIHYTRDPHILVAYLVPFPKPRLQNVPPEAIPPRFLIYTPPPPPLKPPAEGDKEGKTHKVQRKWQEEVKAAKTSTAKTKSWKGVKSNVTKGISYAMGMTKSSSLEFINRIHDDKPDKHADDGHEEGDDTHKTVGLESMKLVYPTSLNMTPAQLREEFVASMMRSKTKAQRDAVLATGLLPVAEAIDICATLVWPFGGLMEIDAAWAYASIRGAKTSRSVTKRLASSSASGQHDEDKLQLDFTPSVRIELLDKFLAEECHKRDPKLFPSAGVPPTESDVLEAIGWSPSQSGGETQNWEDEQWETSEVKDDLKNVMHKAAKEWDKWVKAYEKNPEKALKK